MRQRPQATGRAGGGVLPGPDAGHGVGLPEGPDAQRRALATACSVTPMWRRAVTRALNEPPRVTVTAARGPITVWVTLSGTVAVPVAVTTVRVVWRARASVVMQARTRCLEMI